MLYKSGKISSLPSVKTILLITSLSTLLIACGGGDSSQNEPLLTDDEPLLTDDEPLLTDDEPLLTDDGTAATYIEIEVPDISGARSEARIFANTLDNVESVEVTRTAAREFLGELSAMSICLDESLEGTGTSSNKVVQELKARVLNSESKTNAYFELNKQMGNTVTSLEEIRGLASCVQ